MEKQLLILGLLIPFFLIGCSTDKDSGSSVTSEQTTSNSSIVSSESSSGKTSSIDDSSTTTVPVSSVSLNKSSLEIYTNNTGVSLTATVLPNNATNKKVTWESSDTSVATVNNGKVVPIEEGNTTITVTTEDGEKTATCNVAVYQYNPVPDHVIHIKYNGESEWGEEKMSQNSYSLSEYMILGLSLKANDVFKIHMSGDTWYGFSKIKSATTAGLVTDAGNDDNIKVLTAGTYDIYCDYNEDGEHNNIYLNKTGGVSPTPSVVHVTDITLNRSGKFMQYRNDYQLTATVYPSHATNKKIIWSSSDKSIATVTDQGRIIANSKKGSATITAKTEDGNKTATCIVYVSPDQYPDYYLTGTINGVSRNASYRLQAGVPLGDGRYLISDVQLKKGDKLNVYSEKAMYYLRDLSYHVYEYEVNVTAYVNIYLDPNDAKCNYLTLVNKDSREIYVSYPSDTNNDNKCAWMWAMGDDITSQWIKSSSLQTGSTGSSFLIPNKATKFALLRANQNATPTDGDYSSIGSAEMMSDGYIDIVDGTYRYVVE